LQTNKQRAKKWQSVEENLEHKQNRFFELEQKNVNRGEKLEKVFHSLARAKSFDSFEFNSISNSM
jgi:hypothetical protein